MNGYQYPNRLKYAVILALGLSVSQITAAVGLGPIIGVDSHLGQPLSANIRVDGLSKEQAAHASVSLASAEEYRSRGIQRLPSHDHLRFKIIPSGSSYRIHVSSKKGIREPFINFLLTINSDGQKITREYALFLNPDPTGNITPAAPPPASMEAPKAELVAQQNEPQAVPVALQQTAAVPPAKPAGKDDGFIGQARPSQGNIIPASEDADSWGVIPSGAQRVILNTQAAPPDQVSEYSAPATGGQYGPVKAGETLYSIASAVKPASMSVNTMMHAIKRANPHAFSSSSMNSLMAGVTLTIPHDGQVVSTPTATAQANAEVRQAAVEKSKTRRQRHNAQQSAPAPTEDTAQGTEAPAPEMAATAQTEAASDMAAPVAEVGNAAEQLAADAQNMIADGGNAAASGMDTSLSLEGMDSLSAENGMPSGDMASVDMPPADMAPADMPPADMAPADMPPADMAPVDMAPVDMPSGDMAPADMPSTEMATSENASAPATEAGQAVETVATTTETPPPASAPADDSSNSALPFGLQIWHLAIAGGLVLIGLLLAVLMKARGRKRDIEDIEDMSPAEIDRMVAELEGNESLQKTFHSEEAELDNLDDLNDLSYEKLSQEKQHMEQTEQEILKARLAELAELEALENEDDDFNTLAEQAERLPTFAPHAALGKEEPDFLDDEERAEAPETHKAAAASALTENKAQSDEEAENSFFSDWDFSQDEPTVQTSAHESDVDDFFNVDEQWPAGVAEAASEHTALAASQASSKNEEHLEMNVESKPAASPRLQMKVVPVAAEESVDPEKVEAMEINLDLATSFIATGNAQRAKVWLDEVMLEGSAAQKALAAQLLKKVNAQK